MTRTKIRFLVDRFFVILLAITFLLSITGFVFETIYIGRIYPGLKVGSIEAGGLTYSQLFDKLIGSVNSSENISLTWGINEWNINGRDISLYVDATSTVRIASNYGRSGKLIPDINQKISLFNQKIIINPVIFVDEERLTEEIQKIADQIDIPAKEPEIFVENEQILISAGENGQMTNKELLRVKLLEQFLSLESRKVFVPVVAIEPKLSENQVLNVKEIAQGSLGKKLILQNGEEIWEVGQEQLISWIDLRSGEWSEIEIAIWIDELATAVDKPAQNATFRYIEGGRVEEFKPAQLGVKLETRLTVERIISELISMLSKPEKEIIVDLVTTSIEPEIDNHEVNNLGIKELVGVGESWYSGSITNRIFNLKKAAEVINGTLVAPDEIFSFNTTVGDVSASTGYKQAYIIKDGKTILGDGGGVCQVSSTLFRAVLAAGLPVIERLPHAYRVHYYEEKYQPGFDATVFQPSPDFKFKNDTGHHLLIQAVYDEKEKYLAFEFYGTNDGRQVEISKARIWEVTPPPPDLYQDDPTLPVGKVIQTEHAAWGAKVAFDWKVTRGEEMLQERTFFSNYKPWQAVYLRGTKPL